MCHYVAWCGQVLPLPSYLFTVLRCTGQTSWSECHPGSRFSFLYLVLYHCGDEHTLALGSGEGIQEALGTGRPALDEYWGCQLLLNTVGPYLTDCKPPMDVWQHLGQFAHTSHTYHDCTGVIKGALQCSIMGLGSDSPFGQRYPYSVSSYLLSSQLPHVWSNTILYYRLATQVVRLLFLSFHWFPSVPTCYLHLDDRYWTFGISSSLIRLLPYRLQNPYGHSPCLLIFAVWYVLAPV